MARLLSIYLNDELIIEHDRDRRLPGHQRLFLDNMDQDMDKGISLDSNVIEKPDAQQRMQYVAMRLVQGILSDNQGTVSATCAYLCNRYDTLKEIHALEQDEEASISFVFD